MAHVADPVLGAVRDPPFATASEFPGGGVARDGGPFNNGPSVCDRQGPLEQRSVRSRPPANSLAEASRETAGIAALQKESDTAMTTYRAKKTKIA